MHCPEEHASALFTRVQASGALRYVLLPFGIVFREHRFNPARIMVGGVPVRY